MQSPAESIAAEFVAAINGHNVEKLTVLMAPDHRFVDSLGNVIQGRDKMRAGWAGYFAMVPDYRIDVERLFWPLEGGLSSASPQARDAVVMIAIASGTYAPKGEFKPENRWQAPAALFAQVRDGLIAEWRVYADNEPIRELMRKAAGSGDPHAATR